jgi:hypothetical protein
MRRWVAGSAIAWRRIRPRPARTVLRLPGRIVAP